jgi:hypothetical protein
MGRTRTARAAQQLGGMVLAHKFKSEVLGHADVPAGRINVNAATR